MLAEHYEKVCEEMNWNKRKLIIDGLESLEDSLNKGKNTLLFLELPTAYGKSSITMALTRAALDPNNEFFSRVIHVLPMRSICDDLEIRLRKDNKIQKHVVAQHMHLPGSPFFAKRCVITTLDTFLLNMFKLPAIEIYKVFKHSTAHYEFPRGLIYNSLIIFDEFHLFSDLGMFDENQEFKDLASCIAAIQCLLEKNTPVIIMTATLPTIIKNEIIERIKNQEISIISISYSQGSDPSYEEKNRKKKRIVYVAHNKKIKEILNEEKDSSILIVLNTVEKALEIYKELRDLNPTILHGRIPEKIRKPLVEKILQEQPKLLISTQVLEAGVDLSYDVMITEVCPIDRIIQRAGRVARKENHDNGKIIVLQSSDSLPYNKEICNKTYEKLKEGPMELNYEKSMILINEIYRDYKLELDPRYLYDLISLDNPIFSANVAKELFKVYEGFTKRFGIIACYNEKDLNPKSAIPIEGEKAGKLLNEYRMVVKYNHHKPIRLSDEELKEFKDKFKNIAITFLEKGYLGIAVPEDVYNNYMGDIKYD